MKALGVLVVLVVMMAGTLPVMVWSACDRDTGPVGSVDCVDTTPLYTGHQWATCLTDAYVQQKSKGKTTSHIKRPLNSTYLTSFSLSNWSLQEGQFSPDLSATAIP